MLILSTKYIDGKITQVYTKDVKNYKNAKINEMYEDHRGVLSLDISTKKKDKDLEDRYKNIFKNNMLRQLMNQRKTINKKIEKLLAM